jgi:16S rRNA processing protein RimM
MLLLGHLAKVQGLKGEFLLHAVMDAPERLQGMTGLHLAPPTARPDLDAAEARPVILRAFRWHQDRPCVAFDEILDRTAAEPYRGWGLWRAGDLDSLPAGESYRHDWVGCQVYVDGQRVGEVLRLDPTPMGYDMLVLKDLRPGRRGTREVPYIKAWFQLDLPGQRIDLSPPPGLLDLDRIKD